MSVLKPFCLLSDKPINEIQLSECELRLLFDALIRIKDAQLTRKHCHKQKYG